MDQSEINDLTYAEKKIIYEKVFSIGNFYSTDMNDKFMLISLIAFTYKKMKEKTPSVTVLQILLKIMSQPKNDTIFYQALESLSLIVEDFSYGTDKVDACGFKSSQEIISKIKEILSSWLPF